MDDGRRVELLDDGRAREGRTGGERVAVVDRAVDVAARLGEVDLTAVLRLDLAAAVELLRRRLRDPPDARQAQAHDLDRLGRRGEAVRPVVLLVEALEEPVAGGDRQLVALADVAQVDLPLELDRVVADALALELVAARGLELGERRLRLGGVELVQAAHDRDRGVALEVGGEQPRRREDAGAARDQKRRHLGVPCERVGVHGPGATEADEHEVARVVAALHRDQVERVDHRRVRDLDDAVRGLDDGEPERPGAALLDRPLGTVDVEADLAAEEVPRVQPAEHEVRVRDRRLGAAAAVADRPRVGARALRPDAQEAARVDPGDRAAAGADLDEVDDGRPYRVAREGHAADPGARMAADVVVLRHRRAAVLDQADLRGRAAHVEGEDVRTAERLPEVRRRDHARGRPRLDHEDRPAAGGVGAEDAAARLHHEQLRLHARVGEPLLDPREVALDDRPDDGVDDGRGGAQVLAELGSDLGRERDGDAGQLLREDGADPLLVSRVDVRVQQADRDRLDLLAPHQRGRLAHRVVVERHEHLAGGPEALAHADRAVARDERLRLLEPRVVERRAHLARDLEQVAEALGGDEAAARDLALDDRVRRDGRRVDDEADVRRAHVALGEGALDRSMKPSDGSAGVVSTFAIATLARLLVDERRVGERAADVDRDAGRSCARAPPSRRSSTPPVGDRDAVDRRARAPR